ncbi:MAG: mevalonate kinase, partial [Oligoflexia bacterium]|nr:mevalonate kinase [Oligoflexia bacterium]
CLPFGAGLGASSALCVGMSHLLLYKKWISKNQLKPFSTALEDFFHGKSSGMDVTAVLEQKPILYQKSKILKTLDKFKNTPLLFLSYSGGRASTSVGVSKVRSLFDKDWSLAEQIDKQMDQSVQLCLQALKETNKEQSLSILTEALNLGYKCFEQWELISYDLEQHIQHLKQKGALAVKPTGSGLGGHVISLWDKQPPSILSKKLLPLTV